MPKHQLTRTKSARRFIANRRAFTWPAQVKDGRTEWPWTARQATIATLRANLTERSPRGRERVCAPSRFRPSWPRACAGYATPVKPARLSGLRLPLKKSFRRKAFGLRLRTQRVNVPHRPLGRGACPASSHGLAGRAAKLSSRPYHKALSNEAGEERRTGALPAATPHRGGSLRPRRHRIDGRLGFRPPAREVP